MQIDPMTSCLASRWLKHILQSIVVALSVYSLTGCWGVLYPAPSRLVGDFSNCLFAQWYRFTPYSNNVQSARTGEDVLLRYYLKEREDAVANVFYFHGNSIQSCLSIWLTHNPFSQNDYLKFKATPVNLVYVEYRGYMSEPQPSGLFHMSHQLELAEMVFDDYAVRNPLPNIVVGRSLGSSIATYLASVRQVDALVVVSPYTSVPQGVGSINPNVSVAWLEQQLALDRYPAEQWAPAVTAPTFIGYALDDGLINPANSAQQAENFTSTSVRIRSYANEYHNSLRNNDQMGRDVQAFISEVLQGSPSG